MKRDGQSTFRQTPHLTTLAPLYHSGQGRHLIEILFLGVVYEAKTFVAASPGKIVKLL